MSLKKIPTTDSGEENQCTNHKWQQHILLAASVDLNLVFHRATAAGRCREGGEGGGGEGGGKGEEEGRGNGGRSALEGGGVGEGGGVEEERGIKQHIATSAIL
ncbi:hypothetical protein FHG87_021245 [Trinorchestia longiramus]|nr:hypothetical protein FHG87_021245 [Trinorchestia longiramus]